MPFTLTQLPYAYDALEAAIDAKTMEIHHSKHHNAYVDKLNAALQGKADLESKTLEQLIGSTKTLPKDIEMVVRNNGGGHWNHDFFWHILSPRGGEPVGKLAEHLNRTFGSFAQFKEQFSTAAANRFGSGWAWLVVRDGELFVESTANQDNPLMDVHDKANGRPVLGLDVWEHAYYLRYQNRRPEYIASFFNVVNWEKCNELYELATR
jgi:Fe-Mn family superoxide dismutase